MAECTSFAAHRYVFPSANGDLILTGVCACGAEQRCPASLDESIRKGRGMPKMAFKPYVTTKVFDA